MTTIMQLIQPELQWPAQFCLLSTVLTYLLSIITGNVSQVDRVWTFLPTVYSAYYALLPLWPTTRYLPFIPYNSPEMRTDLLDSYSPRALLMLGLVTAWMFRLSYNTYRRGLFAFAEEDYRWVVLRKQLNPFLFQIVNLTFIAAIQNVLLFLLGLPVSIAAIRQPHSPLSTSDVLLAALALIVLGIEFTADNQQFSFQTFKHWVLSRSSRSTTDSMAQTVTETIEHNTGANSYDKNAQWPGARIDWTLEDAKRGFVTKGLWRYSRHPNFACEQTFWWIITLMPLLAPSPPSLPSGLSIVRSFIATPSFSVLLPLAPLLPAVCLSILFFSSTLYTEAITLSKYPKAYRAYRERVGMFGFFRTWEKGLTLGSRKAEVEVLLWGKEEKRE